MLQGLTEKTVSLLGGLPSGGDIKAKATISPKLGAKEVMLHMHICVLRFSACVK